MTFNSTVIDREDIHKDLAVIKIQPDEGTVPEFQAGQFCTLGLPADAAPHPETEAAKAALDEAGAETKTAAQTQKKVKFIRRAYSIASSPKQREFLELYVVLVGEGKLTPRLWTVEQGGRLFLDPRIKGEFTLENIPQGKNLIMIATGTGLAPFISMMRTYRGTGFWNNCVIIHGVRYAADFGYREELESAAAEDPTIHYIPLASGEDDGSDWHGLRGRVQVALEPSRFEKLTGFSLDPQTSEVFLCGNPAMITAVQEDLEARDFVTASRKQSGNIHFERYW